jgi:hypothetical protein
MSTKTIKRFSQRPIPGMTRDVRLTGCNRWHTNSIVRQRLSSACSVLLVAKIEIRLGSAYNQGCMISLVTVRCTVKILQTVILNVVLLSTADVD